MELREWRRNGGGGTVLEGGKVAGEGVVCEAENGLVRVCVCKRGDVG